jgi:hypothetical protein
MKKIIFTLTFGLSLTQSYSQDSTDSLSRRWQKGFVGLIIGYYSESPYHSKYHPDEETKLIKSDQQMLFYNKNDFNASGNNYAGGTFVNPYISFHPRNKKKNSFNKNQELRIGIIYYSNTGREIGYYNKYDASITGDTTLIDRVAFQNRRDDLGLNIGYIASSNEFWRRFSLYAGADVGIAYSITHSVLQGVTESTYSSVKTYYGSYSSHYDISYANPQYKELKGIPSLTARGNFLAGMNLRIVNPVILFTEGRLGYVYFQPVGGAASIQNHYNINLGFKIRI